VQLSKQLQAQFDPTLAKRAGELATAAKAFEAWQVASKVGREKPFPNDTLLIP
jgi:hypothetical protein